MRTPSVLATVDDLRAARSPDVGKKASEDAPHLRWPATSIGPRRMRATPRDGVRLEPAGGIRTADLPIANGAKTPMKTGSCALGAAPRCGRWHEAAATHAAFQEHGHLCTAHVVAGAIVAAAATTGDTAGRQGLYVLIRPVLRRNIRKSLLCARLCGPQCKYQDDPK